tara:strand:+ start:2956 stop:3375 length:420 start_codon:yes stop_codon:yes gene_type:complete
MSKDTQFSAENQPPRGRGKSSKTKILEAMKRTSRSEEDFYDMLVTRAFDPDDSIGVKEVLARISPLKKAVAPPVEFEFDESASITDQIGQIISATAKGIIPPDITGMLIQSIKNACDIEQAVDLKARIEQLEELLSVKS